MKTEVDTALVTFFFKGFLAIYFVVILSLEREYTPSGAPPRFSSRAHIRVRKHLKKSFLEHFLKIIFSSSFLNFSTDALMLYRSHLYDLFSFEIFKYWRRHFRYWLSDETYFCIGHFWWRLQNFDYQNGKKIQKIQRSQKYVRRAPNCRKEWVDRELTAIDVKEYSSKVLCIPVGKRRDHESRGVAEVLEPVLQLWVNHPQAHRLVLQVVPGQVNKDSIMRNDKRTRLQIDNIVSFLLLFLPSDYMHTTKD